MRLVIQSAFTGAFLGVDQDGQPDWVMLLKYAQIVSDIETASEIISDHVDSYHKSIIVDLDDL